MTSYYDLLKYANTGIAAEGMTGYDKMRALAIRDAMRKRKEGEQMNLETMRSKAKAMQTEIDELKKSYRAPIVAHMKDGSSYEVTAEQAIDIALNAECSHLEFLDRSGQGLLPELLNDLLRARFCDS